MNKSALTAALWCLALVGVSAGFSGGWLARSIKAEADMGRLAAATALVPRPPFDPRPRVEFIGYDVHWLDREKMILQLIPIPPVVEQGRPVPAPLPDDAI